MADWNVHLYAYDDFDQVREAVASIPEGVTIHVLDGRYFDFDGEPDLTPGLREFCGANPDRRYHAPPEGDLPFGDPRYAPEFRSSVHEKAAWASYDILPQDEWTLKMDSDERLEAFDLDLTDLNDRVRYCPTIERVGEYDCHLGRLWKPMHWTFWIDDCPLPREVFPRDTPLHRLARVHLDDEYRSIRFAYRQTLGDEVRIRNVGVDRPDDYQRRRVKHLERLGRKDRAAELRSRTL